MVNEGKDTLRSRFSNDQMPFYFTEGVLGVKMLAALIDWRNLREQRKGIAPETISSEVHSQKYRDDRPSREYDSDFFTMHPFPGSI